MTPGSRATRAAAALALGCWVALSALFSAGCATSSAGRETPAPSAEVAMRDDSQRYIVLAVDNPLESPGGRAGSSLGGYAGGSRYVLGTRAANMLAALAREHGLRETAAWPIPQLGWHCVVFELPANVSREALLARLAADPRVRLVQPLQDFDTHAAPTNSGTSNNDVLVPYNDPYVNLQRGFVDTGAAQAHRVSTGAGVRVAVVDTGAAMNHPDLQGRVVRQRDVAGEASSRFESDRHGTQVAGIIAAVGNNHEGIVGIAPQADLELIKACWGRSDGPGARCNSFTLAKALGAVLESNARVVNLSLGGPSDPLLDTLLGELLRQGRVVVGALPPDGRRGGFPTGTSGVIAAGVAGELPANAGDVVAAPGRDVLTLQPGAGYDYASGSSIAAAHVSGVAALLLSADPRLDRATVAALLSNPGHPALDARSALDALRQRKSR